MALELLNGHRLTAAVMNLLIDRYASTHRRLAACLEPFCWSVVMSVLIWENSAVRPPHVNNISFMTNESAYQEDLC